VSNIHARPSMFVSNTTYGSSSMRFGSGLSIHISYFGLNDFMLWYDTVYHTFVGELFKSFGYSGTSSSASWMKSTSAFFMDSDGSGSRCSA